MSFHLKRERLFGAEWPPKGTEFKDFERTQYIRETIIIISNKTWPMIWRTLLTMVSITKTSWNQIHQERILHAHGKKKEKKKERKKKKQCSTLLIIRKRQVKITMWCHVNQSEWPSSKSLQIEMLERGWRKEPFYILGGDVNWYNHNGASLLIQQ